MKSLWCGRSLQKNIDFPLFPDPDYNKNMGFLHWSSLSWMWHCNKLGNCQKTKEWTDTAAVLSDNSHFIPTSLEFQLRKRKKDKRRSRLDCCKILQYTY